MPYIATVSRTSRNRSRALALLGTLMITLAAACTDEPGPLPPNPVVRVEVSPSAVELQVGDTHELRATPRAQDGTSLPGRPVAWRSSDEMVARVDDAGRVAALQPGSVTITASSEGRSGTAHLTILAALPAPTLGALSPATVEVGGSGFVLTITGTGFTPSTRVRLSDVERPVTYVSETELRAHVTALDIASAGNVAITAANPPPGGGTSNALTLTVAAVPAPNPAPRIGSLFPRWAVEGGESFTLVVWGSGFTAASTVRWNDADRPTSFVSATELRASISAADLRFPGVARVGVFNPAPGGGTAQVIDYDVAPITRLPLHMLRADYRKHAVQLAVRTMEREGPVEIPTALVDRYHEALMRVAEFNHPARDSVVDYFRVVTGEERGMHDVWVQLDPAVAWVYNLRPGARSTGSAQVDALMDQFGLALVEYTGFDRGSQARFRAAAPLNASALAARFPGIEGVVSASGSGRFGYGRDIRATSVGSAIRLEYRVGLGFCPVGCEWHSWTFDVQADGSVFFRGSTGPDLPAPNRL